MEPLIIITAFNRCRETTQTLAALTETTDLEQVQVVIVDNGSSDDTRKIVMEWQRTQIRKPAFYAFPQNRGCPKALNYALQRHRLPGQPVVKLDNDVRILTPGWVDAMHDLVTECLTQGDAPAMIGAYYDGALEGRLLSEDFWHELPLYHARPIIGHAVWHTGEFMDRVGYFDVLADDHLYGFEDLILSHKTDTLNMSTLIWRGWEIENLQRKNSLGGGRDDHVEQMRPFYKERCAQLAAGGSLRTGPGGRPVAE